MKELSKKQRQEITKGYKWNSEMSYESFVKSNPQLSNSVSYHIFLEIEERYIQAKYGN